MSRRTMVPCRVDEGPKWGKRKPTSIIFRIILDAFVLFNHYVVYTRKELRSVIILDAGLGLA